MKFYGKIRPPYLLVIVIIYFSSFCYSFPSLHPLSQSTTISHQAHSFDDLAEWRQLIAKGTRFIKVDIHYTMPPLCASQPRVLNSDNRGCYLVTHDAPQVNETYYTFSDVIAFFIDPSNSYLFPKGSKFYIYIAFKNNRDRYPPANITASNYLQIDFVMLFTNQLRASKIDTVELVYDGTYVDERGKAYNWARTYAFTTADAKSPTSCLYSNSGKCRNTTVINNMANPLPFVDPSLALTRLCDAKFGKYLTSQYPWVFYEPTDQQTVLFVLDAYLNCGIEHKPGFAIAINVDPIQYEIYAGTRSGKAWNARIFEDAKWAHVVPLSSNASSLGFLTLYLTKDDKIAYHFANGAINYTSGNNTFPYGPITLYTSPQYLRFPFATSPFQKLKTISFNVLTRQYVVISDFRGLVGIYEVSGSTLHPIGNATFTHKQSESITHISSTYEVDAAKTMWIVVDFLQGYKSFQFKDQCTFFVQWWRLRFDFTGTLHSELTPIGDPSCAVYSPTRNPIPIDSASVTVSRISSPNSTSCANSTHAGLLVVSSYKIIYGGVVCVNASSKTVRVCTDRLCTITQEQQQKQQLQKIKNQPQDINQRKQQEHTHQPQTTSVFSPLAALDVGTFPTLSLASLPTGEIVALEVHGDGYCYNSDWNNKRSMPRVCHAVPVSSRYVLNYNYGRLTDWENHIFTKPGMITSCDGSIFHGVYDEGSLPSAFLTVDQQANVRMVEAHTGFPVGAVDYAGCSWPVPYDGAIIDGITLPPVSQMIGGTWEPSAAIMKQVTMRNNSDNYIYSLTGEVTVTTVLCNMCKTKLNALQEQYQSDYELMHNLALRMSEMCGLGRILAGDGTVEGCKNLILLYVPALSVDLVRSVLSPDNCEMMSFCSGNSSSILPDINNQLAKQQSGGYKDLTLTQEEASSENAEDESAVVGVIRDAIKSNLLEILGFGN